MQYNIVILLVHVFTMPYMGVDMSIGSIAVHSTSCKHVYTL